MSLSRVKNPGSVSSVGRKAQQTSDFFPILSYKEVVVCLQSCNINVNEENLVRPTTQFTEHLFFDLIPPEFLSTSLSKNIEKMRRFDQRNSVGSGEDDDKDSTFQEFQQTLPILAIQRELYEFLKICGISDFNLMDIYRPDSYRLNRILSAIVNFARFRYERSGDYQDLIEISENKLIKRNELIDKNEEFSNKINNLKEKKKNLKSPVKEKIQEINNYQNKIQKNLKELKVIQDKLSKEHLNYKMRRDELINLIQQENENIINLNEENEKIEKTLNKIDFQNVDNYKNEINDIKQSINNLKVNINNLNEKNRKYQITMDSINFIKKDLNFLTENLISNIKKDLDHLKVQESKLLNYKDIKDFKTAEIIELDRKIQQFNQQIINANEKFNRYSAQKKEIIDNHVNKMKNLQELYNKLMDEKKLKDSDLSLKKLQLNDYNEKIKRLTSEFEHEVVESNYQIKLLLQHVDIYVKKINSSFRNQGA